MIIKWTEKRVKVISGAFEHPSIILLPGNNEILPEIEDDKEKRKCWNKIKELYALDKELKSGRLIEVIEIEEIKDEKDGKVKEKKKSDFVDFDNEKKRELVGTTYNIKTLEAWRKKESDADIRNLIDDQIKAIKEHKADEPKDKPGSHV